MPMVMVVDDEDVLVELVAALIEDMGLQTIVATNGADALASLVDTPEAPALILSDVMMPQMNGVELAQAIKSHPRLRGVPIVLMSAAGQPSGMYSADGFIHKPFDLEKLATLIQSYIVS